VRKERKGGGGTDFYLPRNQIRLLIRGKPEEIDKNAAGEKKGEDTLPLGGAWEQILHLTKGGAGPRRKEKGEREWACRNPGGKKGGDIVAKLPPRKTAEGSHGINAEGSREERKRLI